MIGAHYLSCDGDLSDVWENTFPFPSSWDSNGVTWHDYQDNSAFCAATSNLRNIGCLCIADEIVCRRHNQWAVEHCKANCECLPERFGPLALWNFTTIADPSPRQGVGAGSGAQAGAQHGCQDGEGEKSCSAGQAPPAVVAAPVSGDSQGQNALEAAAKKSCGGSCTKLHECVGPCQCTATPVPNRPMTFLSNCIMPQSTFPRRARRGLRWEKHVDGGRVLDGNKESDASARLLPAPCNSSYVSHACRDSPSGVVFEDASKNLGRLLGMDEVDPIR